MELPRVRIVGTRLAPPNELMKWLHERHHRTYEEGVNAPAFHALWSWRRDVSIELPLIVTSVSASGGLKAAVLAFDASLPGEESLFGRVAEERASKLALFDDLEQNLFRQAVALYYHFMLENRDAILPGALDGAPFWQTFLVKTFYQSWRSIMRRGLKLENFDVAKATASIEACFHRVNTMRKPGTQFLGGDKPNDLDVIFAALASPVTLSERHSGKPPKLKTLPDAFRALVQKFRSNEGGKLALAVYEQRTTPQAELQHPKQSRSILSLFLSPPILRFAARTLVRLGPRRINFGRNVIVSRWHDVVDVLERDRDFIIAPVNASRIEAVSGPFILGMDRSAALFAQRQTAYAAIQHVGSAGVRSVLEEEPHRLIAEALRRGGAIDVVNGYARPVATRVAARLFGISGPAEADLMRVVRAMFHETFLNLGGDAEVRDAGIAAGLELRSWIEAECILRQSATTHQQDFLGALIQVQQLGDISKDEVAHILAGMLVGSIDTTATAVAHIMAEAMASPSLLAGLKADIDDRVRFYGWCMEALRRRPHNPLLVRQSVDGANLCGKPVTSGSTVYALTLAAMQDFRVFDSPAKTMSHRPPDLYLHLGRGLHLCAGRDINFLQIPHLVAMLLRHNPAKADRIIQRGPFPDTLRVLLKGPAI